MTFTDRLGKSFLYMGLIIAGYNLHGCISEDERYTIRRYRDEPFLVDTGLKEKLPILHDNGTLQTGTLDYRLRTLLDHPQLLYHLDTLERQRGDVK